jgi:hypothetical protein
MVVVIQVMVFWIMMYNNVVGYKCFRGPADLAALRSSKMLVS